MTLKLLVTIITAKVVVSTLVMKWEECGKHCFSHQTQNGKCLNFIN